MYVIQVLNIKFTLSNPRACTKGAKITIVLLSVNINIAKLSPSSSFSSAELALISHFAVHPLPAVHLVEYQNEYIW